MMTMMRYIHNVAVILVIFPSTIPQLQQRLPRLTLFAMTMKSLEFWNKICLNLCVVPIYLRLLHKTTGLWKAGEFINVNWHIYLRPNIVTIVSVTVYSALLKQFASCQICKKTGTGQMRAFGLKTDNNTNCDCCSVQLFIFARETTDTYFKWLCCCYTYIGYFILCVPQLQWRGDWQNSKFCFEKFQLSI